MRSLTTQLRRAWRLTCALGRVPGAVGRSLGYAVRPPAEDACLASLEGEPFVRAGATTAHRVRVYNPTGTARTLSVIVEGRVDVRPEAGFRLEWTATLDPGAAAERWVSTDWRGRAQLLDHAPDEAPLGAARDVVGRWEIAATAASDVLRISGALVR